MGFLRPAILLGKPSWAFVVPNQSPAGLGILIPGYAQWRWKQRERALVLFGSFAAALLVGAFAWGTATGAVVLTFAFAAHVLSVVDVFRQSAFPGFGRWMPVASASGGLALVVYAPVLGFATMLAWPVAGVGGGGDGYLVNCRAYRDREPGRGECVWVRNAVGSNPRVGRVVAGPGEEVRWNGRQLWVDGRPLSLEFLFPAASAPDELTFAVPEGHVLISCAMTYGSGSSSGSLALVARDDVKGRAWAQFYPLWNRRVLP